MGLSGIFGYQPKRKIDAVEPPESPTTGSNAYKSNDFFGTTYWKTLAAADEYPGFCRGCKWTCGSPVCYTCEIHEFRDAGKRLVDFPTKYIPRKEISDIPRPQDEIATRYIPSVKVSLDVGTYKPTRAHEDDAGLNLYSPVDKLTFPKCYAIIDTGVHIAIPKGYVGLITSKSGLMAKNGITSRGTIDSGYNGSIKAVLFNQSFLPHMVRKGDKITQLVILPMITPKIEYVDKLDDTERGENGLGSSGR